MVEKAFSLEREMLRKFRAVPSAKRSEIRVLKLAMRYSRFRELARELESHVHKGLISPQAALSAGLIVHQSVTQGLSQIMERFPKVRKAVARASSKAKTLKQAKARPKSLEDLRVSAFPAMGAVEVKDAKYGKKLSIHFGLGSFAIRVEPLKRT